MLVTTLFLILCVRTSFEAEEEDVVIISSKLSIQEEPYFQLFGFTRDAVIQRHPTPESKALYGFSVASFHDGENRSFVVGAPKLGRRGKVYQCNYVSERGKTPKFQCDSLKFVGVNPSNASDKEMFLGGSVSALTVDGKGYMLYCGHLYKQSSIVKNSSRLLSTGLCNLKRSGYDDLVVINTCGISGSCLAGFSSALDNTYDKKNILIAVGMPNIVEALGKINVGTLPLDLNSTNLQYSYSGGGGSDEEKSTFYTGFTIAFGRAMAGHGLFVTTPFKTTESVEPKVEYFLTTSEPTKMDKFKKFTDDAKHLGGFYGHSLASIMLSGDQRSTLLVGEPFYSDFSANLVDVGRVYIYCLMENRPLVLRGEKTNSMFGYSIATIGDINDDKVTDFAVGCPYCDDGQGAVYIFLGDKRCRIGQPVQVIRASEISKHFRMSPPLRGFGWSLSGGTDFDKNQYPDLVIGTPFSNSVILARSRSSILTQCLMTGSCQIDRDALIGESCDGVGCRCDSLELDLFINLDRSIQWKDIAFNVTIDLDSGKEKKREKRVYTSGNVPVFSKIVKASDRKVISFTPIVYYQKFKADPDTPIRISASWTLVNFNKIRLDGLGRMIPSPRVITQGNSKCEKEIKVFDVKCFGGCDSDVKLMVAYNDSKGRSQVGRNLTRPVDYPTNTQRFDLVLDCRDAVRPRFDMHLRNGIKLIGAKAVEPEDVQQWFACTVKDNDRPVDCRFKESEQKKLFSITIVRIAVDIDTSGILEAAKNFMKNAKKQGLKDITPPPAQVEAIAKAGSRDLDLSNNRIILNLSMVYRPNITLVSGQSEQTVLDDRNTSMYISKKARVYVDQVGPKFRHVYQMSNNGPSPAEDIQVTISIPVATENGDYLIYLFKEVRTGLDEGTRPELTGTNVLPRVVSESGRSVGYCNVPPEVINPRGITVIETHDDHVKTILSGKVNKSNSDDAVHYRRRRSSDESPRAKSAAPVRGGVLRQRNKEYIECGVDSVYLGRPRCIDINCTIDKLAKNDAVRIIVDGWLWASTIVGRKLSDVEIKTSGRGYVAGVPVGIAETAGLNFGPLNISTNFVFRNVKPPIIRQIPIWPIILGIILGILLLAVIIILLYKCGFFKRRRPKPQPEPQSHYVIDVSSPNDRNHHEMNQDSTPLIPKVKGPTSRKDSTDELIEQEFADMERSILTSANEIEMRRKTEEDEEVDRLVRQVSTHEPVPNERPPSFPVDMWLAVSPTVTATTPEENIKEEKKECDEKDETADDEKEPEEPASAEPEEKTEANNQEEKKEEETQEEKAEADNQEKEEDAQEDKGEDTQEKEEDAQEKEEDAQEEEGEDTQEKEEDTQEEKVEEKTEDSATVDSSTNQPDEKSPAESSPSDGDANAENSGKNESSQPGSAPTGDKR